MAAKSSTPGVIDEPNARWPTTEPVAGIALGYLGDPNTLPEDLRQREIVASSRKPIGEFVYTGSWGRGAEWAK